MQKTRPNLTGLAVASHKYPKPPLLDGACVGLRVVAAAKIRPQGHRSRIYRYRTAAQLIELGTKIEI